MTNTTISERVYCKDQSWYFERTIKLEAPTQSVRLKVSIRRNVYDHQSYAHVHFWDGKQWNLVVDAPISECNCKDISYTQRGIDFPYFNADHNRLLAEALKICWN